MNRCTVFLARKAGFTLKGILAVAVLIALAAWVFLPKYFAQLEKTQALSMQAMLVNTVIAEYAYYAKNNAFTDEWTALLPYLTEPASLEITSHAVKDKPADYFFGFGPRAKRKQDGYIVTLRLQPNGQGGAVSAARTGSVRYGYTLLRAFPEGETECVADARADSAFCQAFSQAVQELELSLNTSAAPAPQAAQP